MTSDRPHHPILLAVCLITALVAGCTAPAPSPLDFERDAGLLAVPVEVELEDHEPAEPHWKEHPHHLSVFPSGTRVDGEGEDAFTIGVDYEYRVSEWIGLGVIAEYAVDPIDSTTLLAVADIHIWEGFAVQTGPGVVFEHQHGDSLFVYRFGALYEFELPGGFTVSPQIHYDAISGGQDELVYGLAFGRSF